MSIKYCVWDVGQVIYPYSLDYLDEWAYQNTADKENYQENGGVKKFNYKPYMLGEVNNEEFCKSLCEEYNIVYEKKTMLEIKKALYKGVGNFYEETLDTMKFLSKQGVQNCILSNALPMLADTAPDLINKNYGFTSFDLHLLKPDPAIYKEVRRRLNCQFNEMIFIDDKEQNVLSARSLGIYGIVYNKNNIKNNCRKAMRQQNNINFKNIREDRI